MNTYSAYGVTIRSEFDLPELSTVERWNTGGDVVFRRDEVEPVPETVDGTGGRRIQATPGRCRLSYDSYGDFLVERGESVLFDPYSAAVLNTKILRRLLENEMLGVILHQRGRLVLHASAVSIEGNAVVFLGPRGVGKSTTAAAFHELGHSILEDDIVSVRFENETPIVDPGVPEMRLVPDAVEALGIDGAVHHPDDGGSEKQYQQFENVPASAPLAGCYVLRNGDSLSLSELSERDQLFNIVQSTYTQGLLPDTDRTDNHFQQCSTVAGTTLCRLLTRPDDHDVLPTLVDTVVEDLRTSGRVE